MKILITGGAGFIGSHLVKYFTKKYKNYNIYNVDSLTYAGNLENLKEIENYPNYEFIKLDITNTNQLNVLFERIKFDKIIHLAAESHVDRSISDPMSFVKTNIFGTVNLLNAFKSLWFNNFENKLFYHVSTDEVYGSLNEFDFFTENTPYSPNSPYSASKASADHFVRAYNETYGLPYLLSNCSNNYGEYHFPEKFIPLSINNIIHKRKIPLYGDGMFTRDWLYVKDHIKAIDTIFHSGIKNETFNIGGFNEWKNVELIKLICKIMDKKLNRKIGSSENLIQYIKDRPGHDRRYAIDASKLKNKLNWLPSVTFEQGIDITIDWFLKNQEWLKNVTSGNYKSYYNKQYKK